MADVKYRYAHQQERTRRLAILRDGDPCCRCYRPMYRAQARSLHLDHASDGATYRGLAHAVCNMRAGGRIGARITHAKRRRARLPTW
jgi:hypothetical protein